jgi:uncharacterized membrane-anchored protein
MKSIARLACLAGLLLVVNSAAADQGVYPKTDEELAAAFNALTWRDEARAYALDRSHAHIQLPAGKLLLLGSDAERFGWLVSGVEFPGTEALMSYDAKDAAVVYYEWRDEGYVSDSDWAEVDRDALLEQYREATRASNEERAKNGFAPMEVVGWIQPPNYDATSRTVTYAMELKDTDSHWANAVALRLGRTGYTEFTWAGSIALLQNSGNHPELLNTALDTHEFDEGYRYTDFQEGDKVAAFGIAGLVATALGLKLGGKGLIAAIIAFIVAGKKIIIPAVLLGGAGLAKYWRRIFNRGGAES